MMKAKSATEYLATFLDGEHFRYRRFANDGPRAEETSLDLDWRLQLDAPPTPLTEQMSRDFQTFCEKCMEVRLVSRSSHGSGVLRWRIRKAGGMNGENYSREDRTVESFDLTVTEHEILIEAKHERGLLHGTHYLERLMADRGGPWLKRGRLERAPSFSPRISNGVFIEADQTPTAPGRFSDAYFSLMSHFGVNGIHLHTNLWDLSRSRQLPELNGSEVERNLHALNELAERAAVYGIDLYLYLNTRIFGGHHPVLLAHPDVRGSTLEFHLEGQAHYNLCSSSDRVLACYEEVIEDLFRSAPTLAGAIMNVGGEGFFHCYTRPMPPFDGHTNCPRCGKLDPSSQVAQLANRCAAAVKRTGQHKLMFVWPYSAFVWSLPDRSQLQMIGQLSGDVSFLSTFDTGSEDLGNGDGVYLFDYNIKTIGPSESFTAQARKCIEAKRPIFAKTETNTTPDAFFVPYLPVHHRWHGRFRSMAEIGVRGFIGQWRFYGMNGSPPEELQYHATWNPERDSDSLLCNIARRDFRLSDAEARRVVAAWRKCSEAWEDLPYSALLCGERHFYMRGPLYLGPAHPLIFNPQDACIQLGPTFRLLRNDIFEMGEPENLEELVRNAPPRYISDLLITMPFGVERFLDLIGRCRQQWSKGIEELKAVLGLQPNTRAQMELDVCETILLHLTTTENVVRFYEARDRLLHERTDLETFRLTIEKLAVIANEEIANARCALPIIDRDPRVGYGHCYGIVYDKEMVESKIAQCKHLVVNELPRFSAQIRFHLWNDYP